VRGIGLEALRGHPAHNEEGCVRPTIESLYQALAEADIPHEILVVNDSSTDGTEEILPQPGERAAHCSLREQRSAKRVRLRRAQGPPQLHRRRGGDLTWPTRPTARRTWSLSTGA